MRYDESYRESRNGMLEIWVYLKHQSGVITLITLCSISELCEITEVT